MIERTLAKRYATALLSAALKENSVEETESTLLALKEVYNKNEPFRRAMHQPRLSRAARKGLLRKPFEGRASRAFLEFLGLLVDKNRVSILPDVADAFDRLADASSGIVRVKVRSFRPMDEATRSTLKEKLVHMTGKKIELEEKVDAALRGGMMLQIGDSVIDGTVTHRLKGLRERLLNAGRR